MATIVRSNGQSQEVQVPTKSAYWAAVLEKEIGGHGYIVSVAMASMAQRSGYSFGCFRNAGKSLPKNLRASIWMGRTPVHGDVVFLKEDELKGLVAETEPSSIELHLQANRTK